MAVEEMVVGFLGLPTEGAAGVKPPLVRTADGLFRSADGRCAAPDLAQLVEEGMATPLPREIPYQKGHVVLYAHRDFLAPVGANRLHLVADDLDLDRESGLRVGYLAQQTALARMALWGRDLVVDAQRHLQGKPSDQDIARAVDSAQRARFAAPGSSNPGLRRQLFVLLAAGFALQGRNVERVLRDARRDGFDEEALDDIRRDARARAEGARKPLERPAPRPLADPADEGRLTVRVSRRAGAR